MLGIDASLLQAGMSLEDAETPSTDSRLRSARRETSACTSWASWVCNDGVRASTYPNSSRKRSVSSSEEET